MPHSISSRTRAGPRLQTRSTAGKSQSPAPATTVSSTWASTVSSSRRTAAIPPWAHAVLVLLSGDFEQTMTSPASLALTAARSPATPAPITSVSQKICGSSPERKGIR